MKLKFDAQKLSRVKARFRGMTTFKPGYWYHDSGRWEYRPMQLGDGWSSHQPCCSVRAFRRKLKKAPAGVKFILCSRFKGHDVHGVGTGNGA